MSNSWATPPAPSADYSSASRTTPRRSPRTYKSTSRTTMHFMPLELERFRVVATAIRDGSFDIKRDVVPPGYVNFCVLHADDPDPYLRYPLPPAFGQAQTKHCTYRRTEQANVSHGSQRHCRHEPYAPRGRGGGRENHGHPKRGGRATFFKNCSRNFRNQPFENLSQTPAQSNAPFSSNNPCDPFREFNNYSANVDAMLQNLEINSTIDGSQNTPASSETAGPSTAATPMDSAVTN
ncbi:hypothetical protein M404DRAFT_1000673 [Pisolithus tinctorius Marx 270]|uniref:Uncharacterized protein n=1 Tax=Pisolithus tinctorius Marx 270 TaxID=870435 RepID=A0A0C3P9E7_PISTI|nr:hypothetical protein M404DRAFT_1000673 [Pisolithus tinctorius Marx 270]